MELLQLIGVLLWLVLLVIIAVGLLLQLIVHVIIELFILIIRSIWNAVKEKKARKTQSDPANTST